MFPRVEEAEAITECGVIGGGAWGTALAIALHRAGGSPLIWVREPQVAAAINDEHRNDLYLPGVSLPGEIRATTRLGDLADRKILLLVTPAQHLRPTLQSLITSIRPDSRLVICSKGIEQGTGSLMSEVVSAMFPQNPLLVLSGPSFALEVAQGLPTAFTLAGSDKNDALRIAELVRSQNFRPYVSTDPVGAQIGGAIKNVIAIACGMADGRGFGDNARAALIARGLAELTRLCVAKGGLEETMRGLSGFGDLAMTCSSKQSRNYALGVSLGRNQPLEAILGANRSVAEGVYTAAAASLLARKLAVDMPISTAIDGILNRGLGLEDAIHGLLSRPVRMETE